MYKYLRDEIKTYFGEKYEKLAGFYRQLSFETPVGISQYPDLVTASADAAWKVNHEQVKPWIPIKGDPNDACAIAFPNW